MRVCYNKINKKMSKKMLKKLNLKQRIVKYLASKRFLN